tara:strand:- start:60 stop:320 length:261 start_codon:yes stop_codon:yes gene_type:complete
MSPLLGFLVFIILITASLVAYLTKQFQQENLNYSSSNLMTNSNKNLKKIEKEKVVAETLNGRFAMIGLIAAVGAYLTTGQIIPGFV